MSLAHWKKLSESMMTIAAWFLEKASGMI